MKKPYIEKLKQMKKIGLLLLAAVAAAGLSSCNDTKVDQPGNMSFVTVRTLSTSDYYFVTDTDKRVYPGDKSRVGSYVAKDGQRALITFNVLENPAPGYDYNVALYGSANIYSSAARVVTSETELEELKDDAVLVRDGRLLGSWTTLVVRYAASDASKHKFAMIVNKVSEPAETDEEYLDVELRHDNGGDAQWNLYESYVSFDMQDLEELLGGKKGIRIRYKDGSDVDYVKLDRMTSETEKTF